MKEYSVGQAYKIVSGTILALSPYFYYRFFADLLYKWSTISTAVRARPLMTGVLLGVPVLAVLIGLLIVTYRFATDLFFSRKISGVLESSILVKRPLLGERIRVRISGRCFDVPNDAGVAELLFANNSLGKPTEMKIGGLNKVLFLRIAQDHGSPAKPSGATPTPSVGR